MSTTLEFNMPALTLLLRRQSEQNPSASYFNVDILKYTVKSKAGAQSCPFQLVSFWKCEPAHTDIKIDYKYNNHAMASPSPLLNVSISIPVDGGVRNVQSKPHSAWYVLPYFECVDANCILFFLGLANQTNSYGTLQTFLSTQTIVALTRFERDWRLPVDHRRHQC